jgi:acyl carrier protein
MPADRVIQSKAGEIESRIAEFIEQELMSPGVTVGARDKLLSDGLLDSIAALRLATFVTQEFEFEIQPADFVIENFESIEALAKYVMREVARTG